MEEEDADGATTRKVRKKLKDKLVLDLESS